MSRRVPAALLAAAVSAVLVVLVAGCGAGTVPEARPGSASRPAAPSGDPSPSAAPVASPAPVPGPPARGITVAGTGYRFRAPTGWRDVTGTLAAGAGVDRAAGARRADHGFNSNVNVVVTRGALTPAQVVAVASSIRDRIRRTAPSYAVRPPVLLAGETAGHLAGLRSRARPPYWLEQYVVSHGTHAYVVSFSFSPRVPAAQRQRTIGSVLASWTWR